MAANDRESNLMYEPHIHCRYDKTTRVILDNSLLYKSSTRKLQMIWAHTYMLSVLENHDVDIMNRKVL